MQVKYKDYVIDVKKGTKVNTLIFGGGQENGLRSGTENVFGIASFAYAAEKMRKEQKQNFEKVKTRFIEFAKKSWIYEITNNPNGVILDKYFRKEQNLDDTFVRLKTKYDLLYKEYEVEKMNKHHKWIISIIGVIIVISLMKVWITLIN